MYGDDKAWEDQELSPSLCGRAGFQCPVVWTKQDFSALCPQPQHLVMFRVKEGVGSAVSYLESRSCRLGDQVSDEITQLKFTNPQTHHARRLHFFSPFLSVSLCQISFLCSRELQILLCSYHKEYVGSLTGDSLGVSCPGCFLCHSCSCLVKAMNLHFS